MIFTSWLLHCVSAENSNMAAEWLAVNDVSQTPEETIKRPFYNPFPNSYHMDTINSTKLIFYPIKPVPGGKGPKLGLVVADSQNFALCEN